MNDDGWKLLFAPREFGMGYPEDFQREREYEFTRDGWDSPQRFKLSDAGPYFNVAGLLYREIAD